MIETSVKKLEKMQKQFEKDRKNDLVKGVEE